MDGPVVIHPGRIKAVQLIVGFLHQVSAVLHPLVGSFDQLLFVVGHVCPDCLTHHVQSCFLTCHQSVQAFLCGINRMLQGITLCLVIRGFQLLLELLFLLAFYRIVLLVILLGHLLYFHVGSFHLDMIPQYQLEYALHELQIW